MSQEELRAEMGDEQFFETLKAKRTEWETMDR